MAKSNKNRVFQVLNPNHLECRQFLPREFFMNPEDGLNKASHRSFSRGQRCFELPVNIFGGTLFRRTTFSFDRDFPIAPILVKGVFCCFLPIVAYWKTKLPASSVKSWPWVKPTIVLGLFHGILLRNWAGAHCKMSKKPHGPWRGLGAHPTCQPSDSKLQLFGSGMICSDKWTEFFISHL